MFSQEARSNMRVLRMFFYDHINLTFTSGTSSYK